MIVDYYYEGGCYKRPMNANLIPHSINNPIGSRIFIEYRQQLGIFAHSSFTFLFYGNVAQPGGGGGMVAEMDSDK